MEKYFEDLFRDLGLDDAERENWYKARYYVRKVMEPLEGNGISPTSSKNVHVVLKDVDLPLMQAVLRQVCLDAHYPNFNEKNGNHRTVITVCSADPEKTYEEMKPDEASKEKRLLGNLLRYCKCTVKGKPCENLSDLIPLDIEFEFLDDNPYADNKEVVNMASAEVEKATETFDSANAKIDVTMGMLVNMVYHTGAEIDNLPASDNANIERYSTALNVFCYKLKSDMIRRKWRECARPDGNGRYNEIDIKNKLSSVFCADCFKARMKGLLDTKKKSLSEYLRHDFDTVVKAVCDVDTLNALARCEHSRWNVEKLIMGFQPLLETDWYELENCFGKERSDKIKELKRKESKHIDLCSYGDLHRVNPSDIKYDYFLMLAMPQIMRGYLLAE